MSHHIYFGDNMEVLAGLPAESVDLIYIDPPFNVGHLMSRTQIKTVRDEAGDRQGFGGKRYSTLEVSHMAFDDQFEDYLAFIGPRLEQASRLLSPTGTLYFHIDYREAAYCKILLDMIFGRDNFVNEIIWSYDYGARTKKRWPAKHDNIYMYSKTPGQYTFNYEQVDRIPYLAPDLQKDPERAARGKLPTDSWFLTIVPTNSREKTGYPTQKPLKLLRRIVTASSNPGDTVLDFFAGSGTTGAACLELGRRFILVDQNPQAMRVMEQRFAGVEGIEWHCWQPGQG